MIDCLQSKGLLTNSQQATKALEKFWENKVADVWTIQSVMQVLAGTDDLIPFMDLTQQEYQDVLSEASEYGDRASLSEDEILWSADNLGYDVGQLRLDALKKSDSPRKKSIHVDLTTTNFAVLERAWRRDAQKYRVRSHLPDWLRPAR